MGKKKGGGYGDTHPFVKAALVASELTKMEQTTIVGEVNQFLTSDCLVVSALP